MSETALAKVTDLHARGEPIVMLTAYDYPSARIAVDGGVDVILVGDSAAMTVLGYSSTREISMDELLMLTRAVRRAVTDIPVIGDLPFGSYEGSDEIAVQSARRFVDEAGCDAVKLEGAGEVLPRVKAIIAAGIPVYGHVGLLPQSVRTREGYRARGRDPEQALAILRDADDLTAAGCRALIVEAVPAAVTEIMTRRVGIPVIGIGAGIETSGQVLVYHDLLGFTQGRMARFVKQYASAHDSLTAAVREWSADVRARRYPALEHTYPITAEALAEVSLRFERAP
ncbi:MAG: 3-methyl-2-oxobutanoate hydroxymethyltransferase [bacterium]